MTKVKDTRPVARPKDVSDVSEYHDKKTQELIGYSVSITTEDNCYPGIFQVNPFRPPLDPHAYILSFEHDYPIFTPTKIFIPIKITYVFPIVISEYKFPKLKLFKRNVIQPAFKFAADFKRKMLEQKEHLM